MRHKIRPIVYRIANQRNTTQAATNLRTALLLALCFAIATPAATTQETVYPEQTFGMNAFVLTAEFSPDGNYMFIMNNVEAALLDVETGTKVQNFAGHRGYVTSATFSPDGTRVLTGSSDATAKL